MRSWYVSAAVPAVLVLSAAIMAGAADYYWVGSGGNWSDTNNWAASSGGAGGAYNAPPGSADHVRFDANGIGNSVIDADYTVAYFTADGYSGTLSFPTNVTADLTVQNDFYLGADATLVTSFSSTNGHGAGRVVTVGGNADVLGHIDADGQGFLGVRYLSSAPGLPGPGWSGNNSGCGGSHGGRGGFMYNEAVSAYGSYRQPTSLGSGGSWDNINAGGAVKLDVTGTLTLDGSITANGQSAWWTGGSGGSVWLIANSFAGAGAVRAEGGAATGVGDNYGGGGGGRIALEYGSSTFSGTVSVNANEQAGRGTPGQPGTLWEPQRFGSVIGAPGSPANVTVSASYQYYFPDATPRYWTLTVNNGAWFEVHSGTVEVVDLVISNGTFTFGDYAHRRGAISDMTSMVITGDVTLAAADSRLYLPAETYHWDALYIASNATLYPMGDRTAVNAESGGTAAKPAGAGPAINCSAATVYGSIDAEHRGFPNWYTHLGSAYRGPGGGGYYTAASHAGIARYGSKTVYGVLSRPTALGSAQAYSRGDGGGALRLNADSLALHGTITADGTYNAYAGGGSGGSIWISVGVLTGSGEIRANGADAGPNSANAGGGGGGRVFVEYDTAAATPEPTVDGGLGGYNYIGERAGETGSVFLCRTPVPGACSGWADITLDSDFDVQSNSNGVKVTRTIARWTERRLEWTDVSADMTGAHLDNTVSNLVNGLSASTPYLLFDNDVYIETLQSDTGGALSFEMSLTEAAHAVRLQRPPQGTLFLLR